MSRRLLTAHSFPSRENESGQRLCRWCHEIVKPPRRTFCKQECVDRYLMATDWGHIRARVLERDKGICAQCGCDCLMIYRTFQRVDWQARQFLKAIWNIRPARDYWEADHIVEVVRGGLNDMGNLQTLCIPCHKEKTAKLARERAQERRDSARLLLRERDSVL